MAGALVVRSVGGGGLAWCRVFRRGDRCVCVGRRRGMDGCGGGGGGGISCAAASDDLDGGGCDAASGGRAPDTSEAPLPALLPTPLPLGPIRVFACTVQC